MYPLALVLLVFRGDAAAAEDGAAGGGEQGAAFRGRGVRRREVVRPQRCQRTKERVFFEAQADESRTGMGHGHHLAVFYAAATVFLPGQARIFAGGGETISWK